MNPEWLRYYIAAKLNDRVEDIDFNPDDFVARVNSDLVGKYVNIASRAAPFLTRHFDGKLRRRPSDVAGAVLAAPGAARPTPRSPRRYRRAREYGKALREVMRIADRDQRVRSTQAKPWELAKDPARRAELHDVCSRALARLPAC